MKNWKKSKTFICITLGYTFGQFVLGGISWWVPLYLEYAIYSKNKIPEQLVKCLNFDSLREWKIFFTKYSVIFWDSDLFSRFHWSITIIVNSSKVYLKIISLVLFWINNNFSILIIRLRSIKPNSDALVCAFGSLVAVPTLFVLILTTRTIHPILFWCLSGVVITVLCLSWTLVSDILLYVIYPNKRSTALAFKILISHLFGDAGSPYIIGSVKTILICVSFFLYH